MIVSADHIERYFHKLDGSEQDAISYVRDILERIAGTWD